MARNTIDTTAPSEAVFEILSDPACYAHWVVGSSECRGVEGDWPEVGATFHHTQFLPRVGLKDTTSVLELQHPSRLKLRVRARPLVEADVELRLTQGAGHSRIEMIEEPVGGFVGAIDNPLIQLSLRLRNAESLRRLRKLAEQRA